MTMNETVGNNLRKYRQAYGYTLEELAERVHKSRSTLSKYEKGLISIDVDTIADFSAIFHIPAAQLLSVPCAGDTGPEKKEFLDRQYVYAFDGKRKRIMKSILEEFHSSDTETNSVQLFYDLEDLNSPGRCKVVYSGISKKFDLCRNYNLQNLSHPMEQIWMCAMNGLSQSNSQIGILAGLSSFTMYPCARKVLISSTMQKESDLMTELVFSKEDVRLLKKYNVFTVSEFVL